MSTGKIITEASKWVIFLVCFAVLLIIAIIVAIIVGIFWGFWPMFKYVFLPLVLLSCFFTWLRERLNKDDDEDDEERKEQGGEEIDIAI